jgi:hypothetical protein
LVKIQRQKQIRITLIESVKNVTLLLKSAMLKWTKTEKLVKSGSRRASNFESKSLALALLPTENQIFMACLDAHLYEIEYTISSIHVKNPM